MLSMLNINKRKNLKKIENVKKMMRICRNRILRYGHLLDEQKLISGKKFDLSKKDNLNRFVSCIREITYGNMNYNLKSENFIEFYKIYLSKQIKGTLIGRIVHYERLWDLLESVANSEKESEPFMMEMIYHTCKKGFSFYDIFERLRIELSSKMLKKRLAGKVNWKLREISYKYDFNEKFLCKKLIKIAGECISEQRRDCLDRFFIHSSEKFPDGTVVPRTNIHYRGIFEYVGKKKENVENKFVALLYKKYEGLIKRKFKISEKFFKYQNVKVLCQNFYNSIEKSKKDLKQTFDGFISMQTMTFLFLSQKVRMNNETMMGMGQKEKRGMVSNVRKIRGESDTLSARKKQTEEDYKGVKKTFISIMEFFDFADGIKNFFKIGFDGFVNDKNPPPPPAGYNDRIVFFSDLEKEYENIVETFRLETERREKEKLNDKIEWNFDKDEEENVVEKMNEKQFENEESNEDEEEEKKLKKEDSNEDEGEEEINNEKIKMVSLEKEELRIKKEKEDIKRKRLIAEKKEMIKERKKRLRKRKLELEKRKQEKRLKDYEKRKRRLEEEKLKIKESRSSEDDDEETEGEEEVYPHENYRFYDISPLMEVSSFRNHQSRTKKFEKYINDARNIVMKNVSDKQCRKDFLFEDLIRMFKFFLSKENVVKKKKGSHHTINAFGVRIDIWPEHKKNRSSKKVAYSALLNLRTLLLTCLINFRKISENDIMRAIIHSKLRYRGIIRKKNKM